MSARIDAIGHTLLHLIATLETDGAIDGPGFSGALRQWGEGWQKAAPYYWTGGRIVCEIADLLDDARIRRSAVRRRESR